jgi:hypothetical protein
MSHGQCASRRLAIAPTGALERRPPMMTMNERFATTLGLDPAAIRKWSFRPWRRFIDPKAKRGHDPLDQVRDGLLPSNRPLRTLSIRPFRSTYTSSAPFTITSSTVRPGVFPTDVVDGRTVEPVTEEDF